MPAGRAKLLVGAFALMFALGSAAACTFVAVPLAPAWQDRWAKSVRPPAGYGAVYVFRDEYLGGEILITIKMDGEVVGETSPGTYFRWDLPPGEHVLEAYTTILTSDRSTLRINVSPGAAHYVWQQMRPGWSMAGPRLQQVDETRGLEGVENCKLIHVFTAKPAAPPALAAAPAAPRPLFDRLGGLDGITAVVDDLVSRGGRDQRLAKWLEGRDLSPFKFAFENELCASSGGPCRPGAATLVQLYAGLGLGAEQGDAFLEIAGDSLRHLGIGGGEERELMAFLAPIKSLPRSPSAPKAP
jgi:hypothetical protein